MQSIRSLFLAVPFAALGTITPAIQPISHPELKAIDAVIESAIEDQFFPGAVVIVGQRDQILFAQAYGRLTYDEDAPAVGFDTIYDMASLTKVMSTTSAILLLVADGKIDLDQPVSDFIDGFDANGKEGVTIRQVLSHQSGLKAYESFQLIENGRGENETNADAVIRHIAALPASYPPGSRVTYSCLNFLTLARVAENAAGQSLEDFLQQRLFQPLGMTSTSYIVAESEAARFAPAFRRSQGGNTIGVVHDPLARYHGIANGHFPGNAGLFSTAADLVPFAQTLLNGGVSPSGEQIFSTALLRDEAFNNQSPQGVSDKRGLGWDLFDNPPYVTSFHGTDGAQAIGHTGFTGTMLWFEEVDGLYYIFLANRTYPAHAGRTDSERGIGPQRQAVARIVLDVSQGVTRTAVP